tara:strand:- start:12507 stop:12815 length:309 start_codon:yes stop_codon:yes gene_type:complete
MSEENEKMTMKVCANPDCEKPFIMEQSVSFILEVGLPDTVREESMDAASVLCVDCNMERLQEVYDITFVRSLSTIITEEIKAYTPEEFEEYEKQKDTETDGA